MIRNVERIKQQWIQLNQSEKKEFVKYILDNTSVPIFESVDKFSTNNSTMRFGDANTCPVCGK